MLPQKCRDHIIKNKLLNDNENIAQVEENTKQYIQPLIKSNLSIFYQKINQSKDEIMKNSRKENTILSTTTIIPFVIQKQTELPTIQQVNIPPQHYETPQIEIYPQTYDSSSFLQTLKDYANQWRYKWLQNPLTTIQPSNDAKYSSTQNQKYAYFAPQQTFTPQTNYYIKPNLTIKQQNLTRTSLNSQQIQYLIKPLDMNRYSYPYIKYPIPYSQSNQPYGISQSIPYGQSYFIDNIPAGNTINNAKYPQLQNQQLQQIQNQQLQQFQNQQLQQIQNQQLSNQQLQDNSHFNGKVNNFYLTKLLTNTAANSDVEILSTTTSTSTTTTTTESPSTTESDSKLEEFFLQSEEDQPIYDQQLRFVVPLYIPTPDPKTVTKFPWEFDPYAYYPPNFRPTHIKVPFPYKPVYHTIRRLAIPNEYLKNHNEERKQN